MTDAERVEPWNAEKYREHLRQSKATLDRFNKLAAETLADQQSLIREAYVHGGLSPAEIAKAVDRTCYATLKGVKPHSDPTPRMGGVDPGDVVNVSQSQPQDDTETLNATRPRRRRARSNTSPEKD